MLIEKAYAKINLALDVINKREDNYHNLNMVMTTVDLYDTLNFEKIAEDKIVISSNKFYVPTDERNFVYKAAKIIKEKYNIKEGIKVHITKKIPVAAGLAGGSSDAACTIKAMNKLYNLNLNLTEMIEIGLQVGSDVPFCIYNKTAIASGRGEILQPIKQPPKCYVVLVKPNFGVSTKEVFENLNLNIIKHPNVNAVIEAINNNDYKKLCNNIGNALETVTFSLYPQVKELKEKLQSLGADAVLMSGSGPTVFALTLKEKVANNLVNCIDKTKYESIITRMLG